MAADMSPRFVEAVINLNLLAPLWCAQSAHKVMAVQEDGGCIVNVTSVSGVRPSPGASAYGAAKAGLINLTTTLAVEWPAYLRAAEATGATGAADPAG
jgi:NAD(P)-dependent dehydrogenase (short-subunit alcohol dehydrogenase family)